MKMTCWIELPACAKHNTGKFAKAKHKINISDVEKVICINVPNDPRPNFVTRTYEILLDLCGLPINACFTFEWPLGHTSETSKNMWSYGLMNMFDLIEIAILISVIIIVVVIYLLFPRLRGLHYTSRLTCPQCGNQFDYNWVPGGSFSAVRLGTKRYMQCPNCLEWSTFEILSTRIKKQQEPPD